MAEASRSDIESALDAVLREEAARILGLLLRILRDLDAAEETLQETLLRALRTWPYAGIPDRPGAWLTTVSRNLAFDHLRRARRTGAVYAALQEEGAAAAPGGQSEEPRAVADDTLRLIFTACHPVLAPWDRAALALRLVCGLTTEEVARAFLASEPAMARRLVRAKRTLRESGAALDVPGRSGMARRLDAVLQTIYLVFNEGYTTTSGSSLLRSDLCEEAARLSSVVSELLPDEPEVLGLSALLDLVGSRTPARTGPAGELVLLEAQDRTLWDATRIARGMHTLEKARASGGESAFVLQAEIAARHSAASRWEETDWNAISDLYRELSRLTGSPIVELNRAVAVAMAEGPEAGLAVADAVREDPALAGYHLLPAARADLLRRLGRFAAARGEYARAAELCRNGAERDFLRRRAADCDDRIRPSTSNPDREEETAHVRRIP